MQLELDRVVFVPVGEAPHRALDDDPGPEARLEMVELAISDDEHFTTSRIEMDREGPSYTSDTLEQLRERVARRRAVPDPGRRPGGGARELARAREGARARDAGRVRANELGPQRDHHQDRASWPGARDVRYLDMPLIQVSSSAIRRRVREGVPIRYLVPDKVVDYIATNELYGGQGSRKEALAT